MPLTCPPPAHHPQLQNRSLPGRMPAEQDGRSYRTHSGHMITTHFPAATGRRLFPFRRTTSAACLQFNVCFFLCNSPQNYWRTLQSACCLFLKWPHWPFTEARAQPPLPSARLAPLIAHPHSSQSWAMGPACLSLRDPSPRGPPPQTWAEVTGSVFPLQGVALGTAYSPAVTVHCCCLYNFLI